MKTMKKLGVLALALVMVLSFAACGKKEGSAGGQSLEAKQSPAVVKYVEENGANIEKSIEEGADGEINCEVKAIGNKIVINMKSIAFDGLTSEQKSILQDTYDSMKDELKETVAAEVGDIEGLEAVIYEICESDGTVIASVNLEF